MSSVTGTGLSRDVARNIGLCKGVLRHAWYPSNTDRVPRDPGTAYIANMCERCTAERLLKVDRYGNKVGNWRYFHVEGYKNVRAESMAEWRLQYLQDIKAFKGIKPLRYKGVDIEPAAEDAAHG